MNQGQVQQDISIIKEMIEKTRCETAESGYLFIIPGILCILTVIIMSLLNKSNLNHLSLPIFFSLLLLIVASSVFIGVKEGKKERVQTYTKRLFAHIWIACGLVCFITGFVLPFMNVYSWFFLSVIPFFVLGIGIYMTGVIYEIKSIQWCGLVWWIGAFLLAFVKSPWRIFIIITTFTLGYILPGLILSKQYKNRSRANES